MVSKNQPDWLPPGWKLQIKLRNDRKIKCYIHSETRQKLYSKPAVLRYIRDGSMGDDSSNETEENAKKSDDHNMHLVVADDSSKWLPAGWNVELRIRKSGAKKGTPYKCYIDPSSENKFFSKPEVLRYLQSIPNGAKSFGEEERRSTRHSSNNRPVDQLEDQKSDDEPNVTQISKTRSCRRLSSGKEVVVENTVDEDLPSGWIKEMRKRVHGTRVVRADPFYFQPASGLVFRSKLDVLRYLDTGEISRHAYRRRNKDVKKEFATRETSPTPSVQKETATNCRTGKKLFAGEETSRGSPSLMPKDRVVKEAGIKRITRSSSRVRPAAVGEAKDCESSLLHEAANMRQSTLPSRELIKKDSAIKETVSVTPILSSEVQDAEFKESSLVETEPSFPATKISTAKSPVASSMRGCSTRKAQTSKRKSGDQTLLTGPTRSSKRLAGVDVQEVFHSIPIEHTLRATQRKSVGAKPIPCLVSAPSNLQDSPKPSGVDTLNVPVCQPAKELSETMLATEEQPGNNSGSLMKKNLHVVGLQEGSPFGFSEDAVIDVPSINSDRLSEYSRNTVRANEVESCSRDHPTLKDQPGALLGNKVKKSSAGYPIPEEQPASSVKDAEQSGPEFSFPSPLWSDPCLEFAYKTLTGAISLDDNLAIEDYIQHQLRTSKQSNEFQSLPDIDMPSFLQNDETKLVPPSPGGTRLPNASSAPPQNQQVKS